MKHLILLILFATSFLGLLGAEKVKDAPFELEAEIVTEEERHFVNFTLSNLTDQSMNLLSTRLPWSEYNTTWILVRADEPDRPPLRQILIMYEASFGAMLVTIEKGRSISGRVSLSERFPELAKTLEATDVVVFWTFKMSPAVKPVSPRFGGMLILPKSSKIP